MLFSLWQYRHDITEILLKVALNIINLNVWQFQEEFEDTKRVILPLRVLIARRILLILDMLIIFSEYRCLKR